MSTSFVVISAVSGNKDAAIGSALIDEHYGVTWSRLETTTPAVKLATPVSALNSALDVRELLGDEAVAHTKDVHSPNVPVGPRVPPELHHPIVHPERLFDIEAARQVSEDRRPGLGNGVASHVPRAV